MKTHQEIRDMIDKRVDADGAPVTPAQVFHALNDRIEAIEKDRMACDATLHQAIAEIQRAEAAEAKLAEAITLLRDAEDALSNSYDVLEWPAEPHCRAWMVRDAIKAYLESNGVLTVPHA